MYLKFLLFILVIIVQHFLWAESAHKPIHFDVLGYVDFEVASQGPSIYTSNLTQIALVEITIYKPIDVIGFGISYTIEELARQRNIGYGLKTEIFAYNLFFSLHGQYLQSNYNNLSIDNRHGWSLIIESGFLINIYKSLFLKSSLIYLSKTYTHENNQALIINFFQDHLFPMVGLSYQY